MNQKKRKVLGIIFLAAAFAVTTGFAIQGHVRAARYRHLLDNGYSTPSRSWPRRRENWTCPCRR